MRKHWRNGFRRRNVRRRPGEPHCRPAERHLRRCLSTRGERKFKAGHRNCAPEEGKPIADEENRSIGARNPISAARNCTSGARKYISRHGRGHPAPGSANPPAGSPHPARGSPSRRPGCPNPALGNRRSVLGCRHPEAGNRFPTPEPAQTSHSCETLPRTVLSCEKIANAAWLSRAPPSEAQACSHVPHRRRSTKPSRHEPLAPEIERTIAGLLNCLLTQAPQPHYSWRLRTASSRMRRALPSKDLVLSVAIACSVVTASGLLISFLGKTPPTVVETTFQGFTLDPAMFGNISDETHLRSSVCERHHIAMRPRVIPIAYGLLASVADGSLETEESAREKMFPNYRAFVWGGCVQNPDWHSVRVYVCPECERLGRQWEQQKSKSQ